MHSQIHRGISLIVPPLLSERAGERLFFLIPSSQITPGYLANCSPSPFGEGRGEACFFLTPSSQTQRGISLIVLPLPSERAGERLYEIPLQTVRYYCSQISLLSLKTVSVTSAVSIDYKRACKRCSFALQNMPFYTSKDALLQCKRASFTI